MATLRQELESTLKTLPPRHRTAFAAACAERLVPAYVAFHRLSHFGDPRALVGALDAVWDMLERGQVNAGALSVLRSAVEAATPASGEYFVAFTHSAIEAATAVRATLLCLERGEVRDALDAAHAVDEALRVYLQDSKALKAKVAPGEPPQLLADEARAQRWTLQQLVSTDVVDRVLVRKLKESFRGRGLIGG